MRLMNRLEKDVYRGICYHSTFKYVCGIETWIYGTKSRYELPRSRGRAGYNHYMRYRDKSYNAWYSDLFLDKVTFSFKEFE